MTRTKIQCHYCGKIRAESEKFKDLCDVCAKKLDIGMISPDDIDRRWELIRKLDHTPMKAPEPTPEQTPDEAEPTPAELEPTPEPAPEPTPTQPEPAPASTQTQEYYQHFDDDEPDEEIRYYCDVCGAELKRGAYKCPKCDVVNDWRNTDLVDDPDVVICDTCGAITDGKRCHNCGGGYD